jgi:hypothetical protein
VPILLDVLEEGQDVGGGEICEQQVSDLAAPLLGYPTEKQPPAVAVGVHGVRRSVPLADQPVMKEGLQQAWE